MLDYAKKPFVNTNYDELIKSIPEKAVYNIQEQYGIYEKQAEFKKPYLEYNFRQMKERHTQREYDTKEIIPEEAVVENIPEDDLIPEEVIVPDFSRWGDNAADGYNNKMIDCLIYEAEPDTNQNIIYLGVGKGGAADRTNRSLLKFNVKEDLEALGAVEIVSATLYVYPYDIVGAHTISAYRVFQNWLETEVTWNSFSTGNAWNTAGCASASDSGTDDGSSDRKATAEATDSTFATTGYTAVFDLTELVKEWHTGSAKEYGVLLQSSNEAANNWILSRERDDSDGIRPYLQINFKEAVVDAELPESEPLEPEPEYYDGWNPRGYGLGAEAIYSPPTRKW